MHTARRLLDDLIRLGVRPGDAFFVHSSFRNIGPCVGDAESVFDALQQSVGADGTLLMPSFNLIPGGSEARLAAWNPTTTPATTGYLTEAFRAGPGTLRSDHYCHSVAARGKDAARYVRGHRHASGMRSPWDAEGYGRDFGRESPFVLLYGNPAARILLLGVGHEPSTFLHLVEVMYWNRLLANDPGAEYVWLDRGKLGAYWDEAEPDGAGRVGDAVSRLLPVREYVDRLLAAVERDPVRWKK